MRRNFLAIFVLALGAGLLATGGPVLAVNDGSTVSTERRPNIVVRPYRSYPGPNAKRHCEAWLVKEYRVSGPVITPQMRCVWR